MSEPRKGWVSDMTTEALVDYARQTWPRFPEHGSVTRHQREIINELCDRLMRWHNGHAKICPEKPENSVNMGNGCLAKGDAVLRAPEASPAPTQQTESV